MAIFISIKLLLVAFLASLALVVAAEDKIRAAKWSSTAIGPDGPWNAVEVSIGSFDNQLALFPGSDVQSWVITSKYCALNATILHCVAGTYDSSSESASDEITFTAGSRYAGGLEVVGEEAKLWTDTIDMGFDGGKIENTAVTLIESQMIRYPDGSYYPLYAGCLSLGWVNETYSIKTESDEATQVDLIPWVLKNSDVTESASFGMHIGSAASGSSMNGSLIFGGYDRSRVVGDILTLDGDWIEDVLLQDIGIYVVKGESPFNFTSTDRILVYDDDDSRITNGIQVGLDPCSPYLTLPKLTCDKLATYLPVEYDASLGLYLWNTTDPDYEWIVSSASVLSFTLSGFIYRDSVEIKVPFRHLNLTLEPPLVDSPVPYFPCSRGSDGTFVLGRAFLQDAFFGANFQPQKWWIAQAPGPKLQSDWPIVSIDQDDDTISSSGDDWESSWDGVWKLTKDDLEGKEDGGGEEGDGSNSGDGGDGGNKIKADPAQTDGLSTGSKAGIGAGVGIGVPVLLAVAFFLWRRRSKKPSDQSHAQEVEGVPYYMPSGLSEVEGNTAKHQMDTPELSGDRRYQDDPSQGREYHRPGRGGEIQELA